MSVTRRLPVKIAVLDEHIAAHVAELFSVFSDTSRVRLISALATGEINVSALAGAVGISESAVSHHLRSLRQLHLVRTRKVGREVHYQIEDEHILALFRQGVRHIQEG